MTAFPMAANPFVAARSQPTGPVPDPAVPTPTPGVSGLLNMVRAAQAANPHAFGQLVGGPPAGNTGIVPPAMGGSPVPAGIPAGPPAAPAPQAVAQHNPGFFQQMLPHMAPLLGGLSAMPQGQGLGAGMLTPQLMQLLMGRIGLGGQHNQPAV